MVANINEIQPQQVADTLIAKLDQLSFIYEGYIAAGVSQQDTFNRIRDKMVERLGVTLLQAANMTRIVIALMGARHGVEVYTHDQLEQIVSMISDEGNVQ